MQENNIAFGVVKKYVHAVRLFHSPKKLGQTSRCKRLENAQNPPKLLQTRDRDH
jgi:hypothetical protein